MSAILLFIFALRGIDVSLVARTSIVVAPRDTVEAICIAIGNSARDPENTFYLRLYVDGTVAFGSIPPSTPPDRWWSWRKEGDSARVKFSGIDSGEDFSFTLGVPRQRVSRQVWWATNRPHTSVDSVEVRAVACPIERRP